MLLLYLSLLPTDSDRAFLTDLYHRLNKRLLGYAYHLSHDVAWSRDATQHVFLAILDRIENLTQLSDDKVDAYCFTIMKNHFNRWIKRNSREVSVDIQEMDMADTINEQPEEAVLRQLEYAEVKAAVGKLPEPYRQIIALKFSLNQTHAEIAKTMGISVSRSQNMLAAAIRQLRQILGVTEDRGE